MSSFSRRFIKGMSLVLAAAVTFGLFSGGILRINKSASDTVNAAGTEFSDNTDKSKYYYKPVQWAAKYGVTYGYKDGTFRPEGTVTRGQMVTFLWRMCGSPEPQTTKSPFSDINKKDYWYKPALWGNENGIVMGYKDGTFGPKKTCTRAQAVTFMYRMSDGKCHVDAKKYTFSDLKGQESKYYYEAAYWGMKAGIVAGISTKDSNVKKFNPQGNITRGQMVTFLSKLAKYSEATEGTGALTQNVMHTDGKIPSGDDKVVIAKPTGPSEKIDFEGDTQLKANTFISKFSEQFFKNFDVDKTKTERVVNFAYLYLYLNSQDDLKGAKKGDIDYFTFSFEKARDVIGSYITYRLTEDEVKKLPAPPTESGKASEGPFYADGKIWYPAAAGESYNQIGIVDYGDNFGDGTIWLNFTVYEIDLDKYLAMSADELKAYYELTPSKAASDKTLKKVKTGIAQVDVGQSGSYYLKKYGVTAVKDSEKITFSGDSQTYANTFISNFAEQYFADFDVKDTTTKRVVDFAYLHLYINSQKDLKGAKKGDIDYFTFTYEKARDVIGKYITYSLTEDEVKKLPAPPTESGKSSEGPFYADGKLWYPAAAGESYNQIGIVEYADNYGDGTIWLNFTVYEIDFDKYQDMSTDDVKALYKLSPSKAASNKSLKKIKTGIAQVDIGQSGKYFLKNYKVTNVG
ncbi:MAG: S-layer homology domain-containing protein [Clostridiales bacterium]|nr:S-layer homology domain-containing protein [Clostridiales bacterium]